MTPDALGLVGAVVDNVRFDACVDSGGFGLVYRGRHLGLDEDVAIKCLRIAGFTSIEEDIRVMVAARFRDEVKLLYRLSQGNLDILRCISSGTLVPPATGELTPYMVLEWLDGQPLSAELKGRRAQGLGGRSLDEAVALLDSAARAIAYAHAQGVVHRDIKPANLFLTRTREGVRMKVLDFGLAKILSAEDLGFKARVETAQGVHSCSPSYGAPEQFSPRVGKIGPWTDVYSLALVLLEVMRGERVRSAGSLGEGLMLALDPVAGSPSASSLGLRVPASVESLLLRAVSQSPQERPPDTGAFRNAIQQRIASAMDDDFGETVTDLGLEASMGVLRAAAAEARASGGGVPSPRPAAGAPTHPPFAATVLMPPQAPSAESGPPRGAHAAPPTLMSPRASSPAPIQPPTPGAMHPLASITPRRGSELALSLPPPAAPSYPSHPSQMPPHGGAPYAHPPHAAPPQTGQPYSDPQGAPRRGSESAALVVGIIVFLLVAIGGGAAVWMVSH